jgi:GNAT superfamily N-acetyltransferase
MSADIDIRLLTENDVEGALALSASCGWNQRAAEWHMMLQIAPSGTFTAATPDGIVGTAIGIDYGNFGWIAMMLVNPAYRSRGLGARLLEAAMGAIPRDMPIRLDATPLGRPLYERYGFVLESSLTRHVRPAGENQRPVRSGTVRPLVESDLPAIMQTDERISGAHRHSALRWAFGDAPRYAWIGMNNLEGVAAGETAQPWGAARILPATAGSHTTTGGLAGYCLGRGGRLFDHIGPIVADTPVSAAALAAAAIGEGHECSLVIDAHDTHDEFVTWLRSARFEPQRPLYRMCRPGAAPPQARHADTLIEFAIMGPEFS